MISLRDVHKVYRLRDGSQVHALDGLSLNIPAGSIHGIVAPPAPANPPSCAA